MKVLINSYSIHKAISLFHYCFVHLKRISFEINVSLLNALISGPPPLPPVSSGLEQHLPMSMVGGPPLGGPHPLPLPPSGMDGHGPDGGEFSCLPGPPSGPDDFMQPPLLPPPTPLPPTGNEGQNQPGDPEFEQFSSPQTIKEEEIPADLSGTGNKVLKSF